MSSFFLIDGETLVDKALFIVLLFLVKMFKVVMKFRVAKGKTQLASARYTWLAKHQNGTQICFSHTYCAHKKKRYCAQKKSLFTALYLSGHLGTFIYFTGNSLMAVYFAILLLVSFFPS